MQGVGVVSRDVREVLCEHYYNINGDLRMKKGTHVQPTLFGDVCISEDGAWARICDKHSSMQKIKELGSMECEYNCSAEALCDVLGCSEKAAFYIDFYNWNSALKAGKDDYKYLNREKKKLFD